MSGVMSGVLSGAAQHGRRGVGIMLIDAQGEETEDIVMEFHLALHFCDGGVGGLDIEQHIVPFAVLFDLISEIAQPPIFGFGDISALFGDGGAELLDERLRALRRDVLASDKNVFV